MKCARVYVCERPQIAVADECHHTSDTVAEGRGAAIAKGKGEEAVVMFRGTYDTRQSAACRSIDKETTDKGNGGGGATSAEEGGPDTEEEPKMVVESGDFSTDPELLPSSSSPLPPSSSQLQLPPPPPPLPSSSSSLLPDADVPASSSAPSPAPQPRAPAAAQTRSSRERIQQNPMMFEPGGATDVAGAGARHREVPHPPDTTNIEYPRAASWAQGSLANVLSDEKGRQLFRCFLFDALADENLNFVEAVDRLKRMKSTEEKRAFAQELVDVYSIYVNISSGAMAKIKAATAADNPDPEEFAPAVKEVRRLLENDQFPRFRRSDIYLDYLEKLLPRAYAEKWATSFEALLNNQVGRHHFRLFLRSIHAEENLRFWEAVVEFRASRNKSQAMLNLAKTVLGTYLMEGQTNEVFLPFGVRQLIERRVAEGDVDINLFDDAIKHIEQVLRNDPYVRFLQSSQYLNLLSKLKN